MGRKNDLYNVTIQMMGIQKSTYTTRKRVRIDHFFDIQFKTLKGRMRAFVEEAHKYQAYLVCKTINEGQV